MLVPPQRPLHSVNWTVKSVSVLLDTGQTHEKRNPGHVVQMERWNIAPAPPAVWGERRKACLEIEPRGEAD